MLVMKKTISAALAATLAAAVLAPVSASAMTISKSTGHSVNAVMISDVAYRGRGFGGHRGHRGGFGWGPARLSVVLLPAL